MTITAVTYERIGDVTRVYATSDLVGAIFYHWYLDGAWLGATSSPWRDVQLAPGDQARLDVADTTDAAYDPIANAPPGYPARRSLWWVRSADEDTSHYLVEQKIGAGAYETVGRVVQSEAWTLSWVSARLTDLATYTWRVTPYDAAGNAGTARVFGPEKIVRRPDAPTFDIAFSDLTKWVTFAEEDAVAAPAPTYAHTIYLRRRVAEAVDVSVTEAHAVRTPRGAVRHAVAFSPLSLSPALWLKADDAATITKDGSDLVSQWDDKSGNARHVSQATGSKQPTWIDAAVNGRAAVDFDGSDDILVRAEAGGVLTGSLGEIWAVVVREVNDGSARSVLGSGDEGSTTVALRLRTQSGSGTSNRPEIAQRNNDPIDNVRGDATIPLSSATLVRWKSDGSTWTIDVDGVPQTLTATSGSNNGDWFAETGTSAGIARDSLTIGGVKVSSESERFHGKVCELVAIDGSNLSAGDETLLRDYLKSTWGTA